MCMCVCVCVCARVRLSASSIWTNAQSTGKMGMIWPLRCRCVCVWEEGGGVCMLQVVYTFIRAQWMGRSERSVVNLYRCLMNPQIKPLIKQV